LSFETSSDAKPQSRSASAVCWPGCGEGRWIFGSVRLKRRRRGLDPSSLLDEGVARGDVRVARRLSHVEHRREADVAALHDRAPLVPALRLEDRRESLLHRRPLVAVHLARQIFPGEAGLLEQLGVELGLDRADRDELPVGGLEGVVEVGAGVQQVRPRLIVPEADLPHAEDHGHQDGSAVDHGGVHHLALPRGAALDQGAGDAEGQEHAAASEVSDEVQGRGGLPALARHRRQGSGQGDVVDVVTRRVGDRSLLSPAGHAPVHEARIAPEADVRSEAEALHHARAEALDQGVGSLDESQRRGHALGVLEVEADAAPTAVEQVPRRSVGGHVTHRAGAIEAQHIGAHVRQHHGGEGARSDAGELDDLDARERSHARSSKDGRPE
jgi:hypothetical protein